MENQPAAQPGQTAPHWEQLLKQRLPLYGHRNWLVVADSAYPAQSRSGIDTIVSGEDQKTVLGRVLNLLRSSAHVRPLIHLDLELAFVEEADAPGVGSYRAWLAHATKGLHSNAQPHEEIIARLDSAGQTFCITVIKTTMTIPYTSVFFELDCAYWGADAESRLRAAIKSGIQSGIQEKP
jgi:hypothetical protein